MTPSDPRARLLTLAKYRAKKRGILFSLEIADIVIPRYCPVLGIRLKRSKGMGPGDASPTVERVRPERGYVRGNVLVISSRANRARNNLNPTELERLAGFYRQLIGDA